MSQQININQFKKDGFIILRNIFTEEQVNNFRNFIKNKVMADLGDKKLNWKELMNPNALKNLNYPHDFPN